MLIKIPVVVLAAKMTDVHGEFSVISRHERTIFPLVIIFAGSGCESLRAIGQQYAASAAREQGTLELSAFIFNALDSGDRVGAPNFPLHELGEFGRLKISSHG